MLNETIFLSEYLGLNDELEKKGVFDAIITEDSNFYINLIKLRETAIPEFSKSYNNFNKEFDDLIRILQQSNGKGKLYNAAINKFKRFRGVKEINIGFSKSGKDIGFGEKTSKKIIKDAYEMIKAGIKDPEIFHLIRLFEENVGPDRLSDMIATIIYDDIVKYTKRINNELHVNKKNFPKLNVNDSIVYNPYKKCNILYLPKEILHELPIAKDWEEIDRVIRENEAIKNEVNEAVGNEWYKASTRQKKAYLKLYVFKNKNKCNRIINAYRSEKVLNYDLKNNIDYFVRMQFKDMRKRGMFNFTKQYNNNSASCEYAAKHIIKIFKDWVENNKGWHMIKQTEGKYKEKEIQKLIQLAGKECAEKMNVDLSFEPNEGNGPADLKISRGNDKVVVEIKLSSNKKYLDGYTKQIEAYAKSEGIKKKIFVYISLGDYPSRDKKIKEYYYNDKNVNKPILVFVNAQKQKSASKL